MDAEVVALEWEQFLAWFKRKWEPGQHMSFLGPTGVGKTTALVGILPLRKYVIAIDAKGGDETLEVLLGKGFVESKWPPTKKVYKDIEEGRPARLLIGRDVKTTADLPLLRLQVAKCLTDTWDQTGWTVYADELQIVTDRRLMNLGAHVERFLIAARGRKISFVGSFQQPVWVPPAMAKMSRWFATFYTRDTDTQNRIAEMAGRPKDEVRGMINGLPEFGLLLFSNNPRDPVIVALPPKVN